MNWLNWFLLATTIVFFALAIFLGKEMLKKFRLHDQFTKEEGYLKKGRFYWDGNKKQGMRSIVLKADSPFRVLVGFKLSIPLLRFEETDWFGTGVSRCDNGCHYAVISTFMGKKPVEFRFHISSSNPDIHVNATQDQSGTTINMKPDITCPPYLYQRLGFYA